MDAAFQTVIMFSAIDMVTAPMNKMAASMGILSARSAETQKSLNQFRNMAFIGAGITAIGAVMAAGLISATESAGKLQIAMMSVKEAMGLTNAELQKATNMSMTLGIPTQFTAIQTAGIMATAANAGLSKSAILDPNTMKQYVNFADVQAFSTKKEDPNTAIAAAVKMANLAGITGQAATAKYLDQVNAALMHTTDTAQQFATNMRYYVGTAEQKGMSAGDIVTANTWLSRMGLGGGRGGMATQQFLSRSVYGSSGAPADAAMQAAGFVVNGRSVFEDAKGAFIGFPAAMKALQDFNTREGGNANITGPLLTKIFGTSGLRVAQAMMQASAAPQYAQVQQQIGSTASVNAQQVAFNATWVGQTKQLTSTLGDIWTQFGFSAMNSLLPLVTSVNKLLYNLLLFMQAHPVLANIIADFAKWSAAIALIVGPLMTIIGVLGWIKESGYIATGLQMIGGAFTSMAGGAWTAVTALWAVQVAGGPILWIIEGIAAACVLLYLAWKNNWGGIRDEFDKFYVWIYPKLQWLVDAWDRITGKPLPAAPSLAQSQGYANYNTVKTPVAAGPNLAQANAALSPKAALTVQQVHSAVQKTTNPLGSLPKIPGYASGTNNAAGGWSMVGEQGPELANLATGSQVINNASLSGMLGGSSINIAPGAIVINATPNQSPAAIAKAIPREIAGVIRNSRRSRGMRPVTAY